MPLAGKPKLLIVDDEPEIVKMLAKLFASYAFDIRSACDGQDAVSVACDFHPDCVITGQMMPRMNGFQEAVEILRFLPNCKFVFMSGSAHTPEIRSEYERLGFDFRFLLPKPFTRSDLLDALDLAGFPCPTLE